VSNHKKIDKQKGKPMSDQAVEKIMYVGTTAAENPEKAAMPFVMANAALALDIQATICLQGNGGTGVGHSGDHLPAGQWGLSGP
jgi:uncharacterized protein involved in oxidation of intracellular sulfur